MSIPVETVAADLTNPDVAFRQRAAEALARMGTDAVPAAVALVKACGDSDSDVREWAAAALEDLGPPAAGDVAALAKLLGSPNPGIGYWAATLLGRCEAGAASSGAALGEALAASPHFEVRQRAAWALGKIGPAAAAPSIVAALDAAAKSDDPRLARLAGQALEAVRK